MIENDFTFRNPLGAMKLDLYLTLIQEELFERQDLQQKLITNRRSKGRRLPCLPCLL